MALSISRGRKVNIIDRTLPEIIAANKNAKRLDIIDFCWMLKNIGVDLIEINSDTLKSIGRLPAGIDFLYRLEPDEDIKKLAAHNIKYCIIREEALLDSAFISELSKLNIDLTVEFKVNNVTKLYEMKKLKNYKFMNSISGLRVIGLSRFTSMLWIKVIKEIEKLLDKHISICPENRYFSATALSVEGLMNGMDCLVVSFTGYGRDTGFAALEEILLSVKLFVNPQIKTDLTTLPAFAKRFVNLAGIGAAESKAILGKSIFKYRPGVYAEGIEQNPKIYMPYERDMAGLYRNMPIGKHSGRKTVIHKLKELGVDVKVDEIGAVIKFIKNKSIELKRDLHDNEIREVIQQVQ